MPTLVCVNKGGPVKIYVKAKIISCGNLVEGLKDGDTIYYDKHAGHDISWKDTLYRVIRDGDVVLVD